MFWVRRKTAEALYDAQQPRLKRRLRLDLSPSHRAADLHGPLDVEVATRAVGERTLQVMGGYADARQMESDNRSRVVLMPGPGEFDPPVERRLTKRFGLDPTESNSRRDALRLLGEDFARWVRDEAREAERYLIRFDCPGHFPILMDFESFAESSPPGESLSDSVESIDPFA